MDPDELDKAADLRVVFLLSFESLVPVERGGNCHLMATHRRGGKRRVVQVQVFVTG